MISHGDHPRPALPEESRLQPEEEDLLILRQAGVPSTTSNDHSVLARMEQDVVRSIIISAGQNVDTKWFDTVPSVGGQ